jgi:CRP-like cAMP-binding protein
MERLIYSFTEKPFNRNQTVYNQGEPSSNIYIVKEGEFEVTRTRKLIIKAKAKGEIKKLIGPQSNSNYNMH